MASDQEILNYIREDVKSLRREMNANLHDLKADIGKIRDQSGDYMLKCECINRKGECTERLSKFVTKGEFNLVRYIVIGVVMLILAQVVMMGFGAKV